MNNPKGNRKSRRAAAGAHADTSTQSDAASAPQNATAPGLDVADTTVTVNESPAQNALATGDGSAASQSGEANDGQQPQEAAEPSIADIGKNNPGGRRGPSGPRTGAQAGAKPLLRALLGTAGEDGVFPAYSMDELCTLTKKSEVNVRTILSDLRSPKYCGGGGVFLTHSFKDGGVTKYRFGEKSAVVAAPAATTEDKPADPAPAPQIPDVNETMSTETATA